MSCSTLLRLLCLIFAFCPLGLVRAMPASFERFTPRQAGGLSSPTTLVTTQTSQTMMGPMTETCTITLTPVTDSNGNSVVQEVKSCTVTTDADSGSLGNSQPPSESPSSAGTSTTTISPSSSSTSSSTSSATSSSSTGTSSTPSVAPSLTTAATSSSDSSSSSNAKVPPSTPPVLATPVTTLGIPASGTPSSTTTSSPAPPSSTPPAASSASAGGAISGGGSKAAATPASAAADATASSDSSFSVPGKHLSVLPIGLGVFAGISVIALIIVGLVTYERTKYRKAFRQRKLAEAGSVMGYSGMAQRTP